MKCPLCQRVSNQNHLRYCRENKNHLSINELKKLYLEYNYPDIFTYEKLFDIYSNKKMSLPDIRKQYNIDYNTTLFMLEQYNIPKRTKLEASLYCKSKRENTNIKKYGAKNVLSKGTEKYNKRNKTVKDKYGVDNVFQIKEIIEKINDNNHYLEKYGLTKKELASFNSKIMWNKMSEEEKKDFLEKSNEKRNNTWVKNYGGHPLNNKLVQKRIVENNNKKYGCNYYFQSREFLNNSEIKNKVRETAIKNGHFIPDDLLEPFDKYKRKCRRLTHKVKNELFDKWDGYDFYDNEYIKENLKLYNTDKRYPTIDHKISIYYGFMNNLSEEKICEIDNLCITKRSINCSKRTKNSI